MSKQSHAEVIALATKLGDELLIKDDAISIKENAYANTLSEGLSVEMVELVNKHNSLFYPAMTQAFGEKAIEVMKCNSSVNDLTLEVPLVGKDHFDISVNRSKVWPNPQDSEKPVTKYGQVTTVLHTHAARSNRGEMNTVRDNIAALALEALCK